MSDTEILDWIDKNASKLGIQPDASAWKPESGPYVDLKKPDFEWTDIRERVTKLVMEETV